ncbi:MAG: cytochrome c [Bdellovibrio bacteriovorus]
MMIRPIRLAAALALPLVLGVNAASGEEAAVDPHALHQQNCLKCHGTEIYTRPDRKVTSYEGLGRQVRRCETALGLRWFDEDIAAVTGYLNRDFYRLMPEQ